MHLAFPLTRGSTNFETVGSHMGNELRDKIKHSFRKV